MQLQGQNPKIFQHGMAWKVSKPTGSLVSKQSDRQIFNFEHIDLSGHIENEISKSKGELLMSTLFVSMCLRLVGAHVSLPFLDTLLLVWCEKTLNDRDFVNVISNICS